MGLGRRRSSMFILPMIEKLWCYGEIGIKNFL